MNGRPATTAALVVAIIVILVAAPHAQQSAPTFAAAAAAPGAAPAAMTEVPTDVDLLVGRSTVLNVGATIARVSLTVPDIADAMVTAPTQLLIHGKQPGTISLFVWDRAGAIKTFEVKVRRDLTPLIAHIKQLFPGESIAVIGSGKDVVISGTVSSKYVIEKAADVAGGYVDKKENVVNLLKQQEGVASNQVMLRVRFAEVSRNALQELGGSLFSDGNNNQYGRVTTQQFPAPFFDQSQPMLGKTLVFSDYLNLFLFDAKNQIGAVVKALQGRGVFQSLAEPNLIALNGKEASFLAGGEFPYPIPQGNFGAFTIQFKEYGVRLNFTPTVLGGDLINLKIRPEVSSLDFNNAVVIEGFRIPALSTRRADTEVELRDGQTFAIAGLMNNTALSSMRKIPGLGDIPIIGTLFKSRAYQKDQSELVVMVTPIIVRRNAPGVSEGLPALIEPFMSAPNKTLPQPDAYVGSPRYAPNSKAPAPTPAASATPAPAPVQSRPVTAQSEQPAVPNTQELLRQLAIPVGEQQQPVTAAAAPPVEQPLTKEQLKALERARADERKAAEQAKAADEKAAEQRRKSEAAAEKQRLEQEKRDAEAKKAAEREEEKRRGGEAPKSDELKKQGAKLELERQQRESHVASRNTEETRRPSEEEQKRQKALTDAEQRLKQAQDAYQAEVSRTMSAKSGTR
jgi:pilus assembly protein CpaC